jgi:predicted DNA-binding protein
MQNRSNSKANGVSYLGLRLRPDMAERLRAQAAAADRSKAYVARQFIERGLSEATVDHRDERSGGSAA